MPRTNRHCVQAVVKVDAQHQIRPRPPYLLITRSATLLQAALTAGMKWLAASLLTCSSRVWATAGAGLEALLGSIVQVKYCHPHHLVLSCMCIRTSGSRVSRWSFLKRLST